MGGNKAQDISSMAGKLLRCTLTGEPVSKNPHFGPDANPYIVSYGHRNPQGLAWLPDGTPICTEHGTSTDELNLITPGENYGWPIADDPTEYQATDRLHPPLVETGWGRTTTTPHHTTSWAPSGCTFYTADTIPEWQNRLLIGGLISQQLIIVTLSRPHEPKPPLGKHGIRYQEPWLDTKDYVATGPHAQRHHRADPPRRPRPGRRPVRHHLKPRGSRYRPIPPPHRRPPDTPRPNVTTSRQHQEELPPRAQSTV